MSESVFSDERFFHLIVEASPAGMVIADEQGKIVLANSQAEKIFGYSAQQLIGESVELLIPQAHHSEHVSYRAHYMAHPEPRPMAAGRDLFAQRQDGSQVAVDISLHPIQTAGGTFVLANILDATDRRRVARERESRQAIERLALLGQLAGSVAHEIRTPLCVIRNDIYYLRLLAEKLGEDGIECVQEIDDAIGKAERIVSELLDFTRDPPCQLAMVELASLIDSALSHLTIPPEMELILPAQGDDCLVEADREQIERVLINLIRNAIQALNGSGIITLRVGRDESFVWLEIADNGPGISPSEKERVFEPLYTTKPTGIGLGLAVSRRYAERNGGSLIVTDNAEGGACFRLSLRAVQSADGEEAR